MAVDGYLNFDTKVDTGGFTKGTKQISSGVETLKSQFNALKTVAVSLGTAIVGAFSVNELIEDAASVNAAASQITQTFGELQSQAEAAFQSVADSSGILETRLQGVGTSIYAFAKTAGMDSTSALNMMQDALQVTADQAAYYDRSLEDTSESLMSFLKGNYANDAALGISCTETTRNTAANKLYGKSFSELSEAQKQLTLLQMVKDANALSGAEGQAAREADGWENVTGNLKEAWKQLLAVVGQPVLSVGVKVVKSMTEALQQLTVTAKSAVSALADVFGIELADTTSSVSDSAESAADSYSDMAESAEDAAESNENSLASFDKVNKLETSTADSSTDSSSGTDGTVSTLSGTVSAEVDVDTSAAKKKMKAFFTWLKTSLKAAWKPFKEAWNTDGAAVIASAKKAFNSLKSTISTVGKTFAKVWSNGTGKKVVSGILNLWKSVLDIIDSVSTAFKDAWDDDGNGENLVQSIFDEWDAINDLLATVNESFVDVWSNGTGEDIISNLLQIWTNMNNTIKNIAKRFKTAWITDDLGTSIVQNLADVLDTVLTHIKNITKKFEKWSEDIDFEPLLQSLDDLTESLDPLADNVGEGLEWFVDNVLTPLATWTIEEAVPTFLETLSSCISAVSEAWDKASPVIKDKLWDGFLAPIAEWAADTAIDALKSLGEKIEDIADSITEDDVAVLIDLAGAITGIYAAVKMKSKLDAFSTALGGVSGSLSGIKTNIAGLKNSDTELTGAFKGWNQSITTSAAEGGASWTTKFSAVVAAAIAGWEIGTAIYDKFGDEIDETLFPFFDAVTGAWDSAATFITEDIPDWWETLQEDTLFPIYDFAVNAWDSVATFFTDTIPTFFTETLPDWWETVTDDAMFPIYDKAVGAWETVTDFFTEDIPEFFTETIPSWWDEWTSDTLFPIYDLAVDAWENVKKVFSFEAVKKHFTSVKNKVTEGLSGLAGKVKEKFSEAWTKVKEVFAFENVKSHFVSVKDKAVSGFTGVADNIKEKFSAAWTKIKEVFGLESVKAHFTNVKTNVVNGFTGLATSIKKKFTTAWTKVKEVFALDTVKKRFESVRNSAVNGFSGIVSSIKKKFSLAWTKVKEVFSLDTVKEHFSGIKDGIVDIFDGLEEALKTPLNAVIGLANTAIDGLNSLSLDIPDYVPKVGGKTWGINLPKIPELATGTVVPANYGEFLAVLGDNKTETEVVSPLSTIEQAVANALAKYGGIGGGDIRIEIPFNVDGKKLHTQIVKVNKAQIHKTGNNPLAT